MLVNSTLGTLIQKYRSWNEEERKIHPEILDYIYDQEWLKVLIPKSLSGGEWSLPEVIRLFEHVASLDANVGWAINLAAGANMFAGYFEPEIAQQIFKNKKVACAGSGAITGVAVKKKDHYQVNGVWKYASGAEHATHFTANCWLKDEEGNDLLNEEGTPQFKSFIFTRDQVEVLDTWYSLGLKATSSHDFKVQNVTVLESLTFDLQAPSKMAQGPLYQFPFATMAVINMSSMLIGITYGFLKEWEDILDTKKPLHSASKLKNEHFIMAQYQSLKLKFLNAHQKAHQHLASTWGKLEQGRVPTKKEYNTLEIGYHETVGHAYNMVVSLYPFLGMTVVFENHPLNKIFRDFMTASQHYQMHPIQLYHKTQLAESLS